MTEQPARDVQMGQVILDPLAKRRFARDQLIEVFTVNGECLFDVLIHLTLSLARASPKKGFALSR